MDMTATQKMERFAPQCTGGIRTREERESLFLGLAFASSATLGNLPIADTGLRFAFHV
jgi:hypothetical protein